MATVELRGLSEEAGPAIEFLRTRVEGEIEVHGSRIEIEDEKARDVKMLLHKFLHQRGLNDYRVLSQPGMLEIVPVEKQPRTGRTDDDKIKGVPPFPPLSQERLPLMDVVYPNYSSQGFGYKKKKR